MGYRDNGSGRDHDGWDGGYGYGQEGYSSGGGGSSEPFSFSRWASDGSNIVAALVAVVVGGFVVTAVGVVLYGLLFQ